MFQKSITKKSKKVIQYEELRERVFEVMSGREYTRDEKESAMKKLSEAYHTLSPEECASVEPMIHR